MAYSSDRDGLAAEEDEREGPEALGEVPSPSHDAPDGQTCAAAGDLDEGPQTRGELLAGTPKGGQLLLVAALDLGGVLEAYQEVARRLGVLTENRPAKGTGPVLVASNPGGKPN